ncbi:MAG: RNA polymerase sigma factor [Actinomycetota bacterium]
MTFVVQGEEFEQVLQAARLGAPWAWDVIYRELAGKVTGYLRVNGAPDPEDLTGEVFLQIVRDLKNFDGDERAFRSWIFTVAHHRLLDERRRRGRRLTEVSVEGAEPPEPQGDTEAEAIARLGSAEALALLKALAPGQRDVLLLRVVGDLTVEEVARAIGRRPGAVKQLQRRGLEALRKRLSEEA